MRGTSQGKRQLNARGPLVSVVIPCYNGENFLRDAVKSVVDQTYRDLELIIIDDGSTDGSARLVQELEEEYGDHLHIKCLRNEGNRGIPYTRNRGVREARGRYIAFLDQDDLWLPEKIEKQVKVATALGEPALVFTNIMVSGEQGTFLDEWPGRYVPRDLDSLGREEVVKALFMVNFIPFVTVLVEKSSLEEVGLFDESLTGGADDYDLVLRLAGRMRTFYIDEPLAIRREHGMNYSDPERLARDELRLCQKALGLYPYLKPYWKKKVSLVYTGLGNACMRTGDGKRALSFFLQAVRVDRGNLNAMAKAALVYLDSKLGLSLYKKASGLRRKWLGWNIRSGRGR